MKTALLSTIFLFLFPLFLEAQELKIKTIERKPFVFTQEQRFSGFSIDLWEAIAADRGYTFTYDETTSFVELLRSVRGAHVDLAIANISATKDRTELMDFSDPIFESGLQVMTQKVDVLPFIYGALSFRESMLLLITLSVFFLILANSLWLIEHKKLKQYFSYNKGISRAFFTLLTLGRLGKVLPRTNVGKFILLIWIVVLVFALFFYATSLYKAVQVSIASNTISSFEDLRGKKIGTTKGSTSQAFLRKNKIPSIEYIDPDQLFMAAAIGRVDAAVHDVALLKYFAANKGRGKVVVLPEVYEPQYYAIAFPLGSKLRDPINQSLEKIRTKGTYDDLFKKWFSQY